MAKKAEDPKPLHDCKDCRCPTCGSRPFYYDFTGKHACSKASCPQGRW